jgi:DNA-binding LytR/AlgR family response regulator
MTMIINIPERVLLIKVSRTSDARGSTAGYVLVFYDITDLVAADEAQTQRPDAGPRRRLHKVPTISGQKIVLVDADDLLRLHSDGHYTRVITAAGSQFCNLGIGDLELRLDPEQFMRVHRSHIVNLQAIEQLTRGDGRVTLRVRGDAEEIPVSRTSTPALLERLGMAPLASRQGIS